MTMRFREYESTPPSAASPRSHQISFECEQSGETVSSSSEGAVDNDNGKDGQKEMQIITQLVWSAPKSASNNAKDAATSTSASKAGNIMNKLRQLCQDLFLPIGYPNSVAEGYLEYQFYDSLQGLCSYLRGVVSTSAVLSATGVGNAEATAMSAAMTWAVRDGLGMIGGLLFSYVASPHFDAYVKEFRLLADILNDVGLTLDMALPLILTWVSSSSMLLGSWYYFSALSSYMPSTYLVLTSTSMLCKVACGMAAGATKGNITDHFAISGNRADCQAKESTQETLVSLVGMCCGVWLAKVLHRLEKNDSSQDATETCINAAEGGDGSTCDNKTSIIDAQIISWSIFLILTLVHVWANYVGMQMLRLRTLNRERAKVALRPLVESCGQWIILGDNLDTGDDDQDEDVRSSTKRLVVLSARSCLLNPKVVSESLWKSMFGMVRPGNIKLGIRLKDLVRGTSPSKRGNSILKWSQGHWSCEKYTIFMGGYGDESSEKNSNSNRCSIIVMLRLGADDRDELKAFLHAHILNWCLQDRYCEARKHATLISRSYEMIQCLFQSSSTNDSVPGQELFTDSIDLYNVLGENGWDMTRLYLGFGPWRCEWEKNN